METILQCWITFKETGENMKEQAMRFNEGKPELGYLLDFPHAIVGMASVAAFGAEKYERDNWKKGLPANQVINSLLRHLTSLKAGEVEDLESGLLHTSHITWNAMALAEMVEGNPKFNDLWGEDE